MIRLEFLYRLTPDWQDLERPSAGQWDMDTKKGREKSSMPDLIRRQTFRTLKLSAGSIQRFGRESRFTVPGIELFSQLRNH